MMLAGLASSSAATVTIDPLLTDVATPTMRGTYQLNLLEVPLSMTMRVLGTGIDQTYTVTRATDTWQCVITSPLPVGEYEIVITLTTLTSLLQGVFFDTSSQELRVVAPPLAVGVTPLLTTVATPRVRGTLSPPGVISAVVVTINGKTYLDNNPGLSTWSVQIPPSDALSPGVYDVAVYGRDAAGRATLADGTSDELIISGQAVEITVTPLTTGDASPMVGGTLTDPAGVATAVRVSVGGSTVETIPVAAAWSIGVGPLSAGTYDVQAVALDGAGNIVAIDGTTGELSVGADVIIDFTSPQGALTFQETDPPETAVLLTIADQVAITASGHPTFLDCTLTVSFADAGLPGDRLSVNPGNGVAVAGNTASIDGGVVGSWLPATDGMQGRSLAITLTGHATPARLGLLMTRLTWTNRTGTLLSGSRILHAVLTDPAPTVIGGAQRTIIVQAIDNRPTISVIAPLLTAQNLPLAIHATVADPESASLTVAVDPAAAPTLGTIRFDDQATLVTSGGAITAHYRPLMDASGSDAFRLLVSDGNTAVASTADALVVGVPTMVHITPFDDPSPELARPRIVSDPPMAVLDGDLLDHVLLIDPASVTDPQRLQFTFVGQPPAGMALVADPGNPAGPRVSVVWTADRTAGSIHGFGLRAINTGNDTVTFLPITLLVTEPPLGGG